MIIDILKTKDLEKAKQVREEYPSNHFGMDFPIPVINGDYSVSNIEKSENGEWNATFIKSLNIAQDQYLYGYLYDLKNDCLEVYSSKNKEVETKRPTFGETELKFRLVQTFCITRDTNTRKLLKIFDHEDQIIDWYEEEYGIQEYKALWEEMVIPNIDFLLKNVVKEREPRKIYRIELPFPIGNEKE